MVFQSDLGEHPFQQKRKIFQAIRSGEISLGGNRRLKIYGTLNCRSGRKMKTENRVFFRDEAEAQSAGYRPCGHCLRDQYRAWKSIQAKERHK